MSFCVSRPGGSKTVKKTSVYAWVLLLAIVSISPAAADVVEIGALQDNTLYEDLDGTEATVPASIFSPGRHSSPKSVAV